MHLAWRHYTMPMAGIARGYLTAGYHLHRALGELLGRRLVDVGAEGGHPRLVLHFCPPHFYRPIRGKVNVLFSMWESDVLPAEFVAAFKRAERLLVPSRYCKGVWERHELEADVVPLAAHEAFSAVPSERPRLRGPGKPLRFLCVGSAIGRKGWELVPPAWRRAFGRPGSWAQLYVKTFRADGQPGDVRTAFEETVTVDTRDLEPQQLLDLYAGADVFVHPSYGEGFGMTALEAMAAGCLLLAPELGGLTEFVAADTALLIQRSRSATIEYGGAKVSSLVQSEEDVARALRLAYEAWGTAPLEELRARGCLRARTFTWQRSVEALAEHLGLTVVAQPRSA